MHFIYLTVIPLEEMVEEVLIFIKYYDEQQHLNIVKLHRTRR